jgi:hypothetical protein
MCNGNLMNHICYKLREPLNILIKYTTIVTPKNGEILKIVCSPSDANNGSFRSSPFPPPLRAGVAKATMKFEKMTRFWSKFE